MINLSVNDENKSIITKQKTYFNNYQKKIMNNDIPSDIFIPISLEHNID